MTHPLSQSIRRGAAIFPERVAGRYLDAGRRASCPLGAAFLGTLYGHSDRMKFFALMENLSTASLCQFVHHGLMKTHPELGADVRAYPVMAKWMVDRRLLRPIPAEAEKYDQRLHPSLYFVVTALHDKHQWSKEQVARLLARSQL